MGRRRPRAGRPRGPVRTPTCPTPSPGRARSLVDVAATAVNRADLLQRQGFYPPPPGASDVLGLECSGTVAAVGEGVDRAGRSATRCCALLAGGGYADRVVVPAGQVMPVPAGRRPGRRRRRCPRWPARCGPTCSWSPGCSRGETFLVHGGAGGIGTFAIQLAAALGARVIDHRRLGREARALRRARRRRDHQLPRAGLRRGGREAHRRAGADVILDNMGGGVPRPQRRRPGHRGPAGRHRDAGRHQGASSTSAR